MMGVSKMFIVFIGVMLLDVGNVGAYENRPKFVGPLKELSWWKWREHTVDRFGCHPYQGTVRCYDREDILPEARIELWEKDMYTDDDLLEIYHFGPTTQQKHVKFIFTSCIDSDEKFERNPHTYYIFKDICQLGDVFETAPSRNFNDTFIFRKYNY